MHGAGIILMALAGVSIRARIESRNHLTLRQVAAILIGLIGAVGLLLAALHGVDAALWAAAYCWLGALSSPTDAILYSVDSMSTRGASGLVLERHWRMMGAHSRRRTVRCCSGSAWPSSSRYCRPTGHL